MGHYEHIKSNWEQYQPGTSAHSEAMRPMRAELDRLNADSAERENSSSDARDLAKRDPLAYIRSQAPSGDPSGYLWTLNSPDWQGSAGARENPMLAEAARGGLQAAVQQRDPFIMKQMAYSRPDELRNQVGDFEWVPKGMSEQAFRQQQIAQHQGLLRQTQPSPGVAVSQEYQDRNDYLLSRIAHYQNPNALFVGQ
jgi:hypothetical protein